MLDESHSIWIPGRGKKNCHCSYTLQQPFVLWAQSRSLHLLREFEEEKSHGDCGHVFQAGRGLLHVLRPTQIPVPYHSCKDRSCVTYFQRNSLTVGFHLYRSFIQFNICFSFPGGSGRARDCHRGQGSVCPEREVLRRPRQGGRHLHQVLRPMVRTLPGKFKKKSTLLYGVEERTKK